MPTIAELLVKISAQNAELKQKLKESERQTRSFGKHLQDVGKIAKAAFGAVIIREVAQVVERLATAGGRLSGVQEAFEQLNRPGILDNLREATNNTVSDLELMQAAVRARNFKIPLDQLATFFEFARNRAVQTGESVDFLVNSIINGIGRKSGLVLDNLGISLTELQAEIKKTGDFGQAAGNIIEREMKTAGDVTETSAENVQQLKAAWQDTVAVFGQAVAPIIVPVLETITDWLRRQADIIRDETIPWYEKLARTSFFWADQMLMKLERIEEAQKRNARVDESGRVRIDPEIDVEDIMADIDRALEGEGGKLKVDVEVNAPEELVDEFEEFFKSWKRFVDSLETIDRVATVTIQKYEKLLEVVNSINDARAGRTPEDTGGEAGVPAGFTDDTTIEQSQDRLVERVNRVTEALAKQHKAWEALQEQKKEDAEQTKRLQQQVMDSISRTIETNIAYADSVGEATSGIIESLLAQTVAFAVRDAFASGSLGAVVLAPALAGLAKNLFRNLIPEFETGTNFVPNDMVARIHQGEAVIPKQFNPFNPAAGMRQISQDRSPIDGATLYIRTGYGKLLKAEVQQEELRQKVMT